MPQDSFGEYNKFFLDLQKVQEIIRKHHQTFLQLFWMTYCNAILPSGKLSLCITYGKVFWGDSEHFYVLVISWKLKHFGANCYRTLIVHTALLNSMLTKIILIFNFAMYQNYPLALKMKPWKELHFKSILSVSKKWNDTSDWIYHTHFLPKTAITVQYKNRPLIWLFFQWWYSLQILIVTTEISTYLYSWLFINPSYHHCTTQTSKFNFFFLLILHNFKQKPSFNHLILEISTRETSLSYVHLPTSCGSNRSSHPRKKKNWEMIYISSISIFFCFMKLARAWSLWKLNCQLPKSLKSSWRGWGRGCERSLPLFGK